MSDNIDNDECKKKTITMFLIPTNDKNAIEKIYIIDTQKLIDFMKIDKVKVDFKTAKGFIEVIDNDADLEKYGPFNAEDIATIPYENAQALIVKNIATKVRWED